MPTLQNPWKSRDDRAGTFNQENFNSKPLGMNAAPDKVVASRNQPPSQRAFGRKYRMGNKRSLGG